MREQEKIGRAVISRCPAATQPVISTGERKNAKMVYFEQLPRPATALTIAILGTCLSTSLGFVSPALRLSHSRRATIDSRLCSNLSRPVSVRSRLLYHGNMALFSVAKDGKKQFPSSAAEHQRNAEKAMREQQKMEALVHGGS